MENPITEILMDITIPHPKYPSVLIQSKMVYRTYDTTQEHIQQVALLASEVWRIWRIAAIMIAEWEPSRVAIPEFDKTINQTPETDLPTNPHKPYVTVFGTVTTLDGKLVDIKADHRINLETLYNNARAALWLYDHARLENSTENVVGHYQKTSFMSQMVDATNTPIPIIDMEQYKWNKEGNWWPKPLGVHFNAPFHPDNTTKSDQYQQIVGIAEEVDTHEHYQSIDVSVDDVTFNAFVGGIVLKNDSNGETEVLVYVPNEQGDIKGNGYTFKIPLTNEIYEGLALAIPDPDFEDRDKYKANLMDLDVELYISGIKTIDEKGDIVVRNARII